MPSFAEHIQRLVKEQQKKDSSYAKQDTLLNRIKDYKRNTKDMGMLTRVFDYLPHHNPEHNEKLYEEFKQLVKKSDLETPKEGALSPIHKRAIPNIDKFITLVFMDASRNVLKNQNELNDSLVKSLELDQLNEWKDPVKKNLITQQIYKAYLLQYSVGKFISKYADESLPDEKSGIICFKILNQLNEDEKFEDRFNIATKLVAFERDTKISLEKLTPIQIELVQRAPLDNPSYRDFVTEILTIRQSYKTTLSPPKAKMVEDLEKKALTLLTEKPLQSLDKMHEIMIEEIFKQEEHLPEGSDQGFFLVEDPLAVILQASRGKLADSLRRLRMNRAIEYIKEDTKTLLKVDPSQLNKDEKTEYANLTSEIQHLIKDPSIEHSEQLYAMSANLFEKYHQKITTKNDKSKALSDLLETTLRKYQQLQRTGDLAFEPPAGTSSVSLSTKRN